MDTTEIYISEKVLGEIKKRGLLSQYEKCENYLKSGNHKQLRLKIREPKKEGVYYFRINRQFRLWCRIKDLRITIFHLDNHQR